MLITLPEVFSAEEVSAIREQLSLAPWQSGSLTAGNHARQVKDNLQLDDASDIAQKLRQQLLTRLSADALFISAALPAKIYPPKFNAYRDGGHYGLHVDSAIMQLDKGEKLRSDVSATLFFNDPNEYDGGELCIETQYGCQQIKLDAGDMVIYPSSSLHEVKAVTRGERIASFFWIQSMVRDSGHREKLFDLDQSIQHLTLELGNEHQQVRQLSTLYHNLLREWAEV